MYVDGSLVMGTGLEDTVSYVISHTDITSAEEALNN